ncbi:MAG: phage tail tape measure protein [Clostridiales bacterium]|nr:phage tail tape measure protein [Clostridiales bacterium]
MSGSLGDLTVRFTGDASQLAATISGVQGQLAGMQGGFKGASSASDSFISGTKKGASVLSTYQRQMYAVGETVKQYENKLSKAKTVVSDSERALSKATATYEKNKKSIFENCSVLKQQEKALGVSIQAKEHEIGEYQKINALIDKNSSEYKDNIKHINQATKEIGGLERQQRSVQNSLAAQGRIMQSNINDYNNAKAAVDNANKSYQSTSEALKQAQSAYKEYESGLAAVEKQQRLLDVQATGKSIKEFGKSIDTVTKPIQIASAALAAGGVATARFAIDFEDNFANVKKTVEGTPQQLEEVRQGIIDLTTTGINGRNAIPRTTAQLTELAAAGGQLGIETPNILEFTETMAQMGTATNLYGAEGAATLARFMNVTNTSQDQVKNLGSAIVDLGNNFATTESEIAILGLRMGATGNVVGISAQDILGYSTALSSMGIEAEAGGSAVSRIWMDIQSAVSSGGEELQTFAKVSGKSSTEFADQWKTDASGAFQEFLVGLSKSEDQVQTLAELGFNNIRDIQALQRLASEKGIQLVTEALQRANAAWSENIALQKEADAKAETTAGQLQITKNNLVEAGRSIGETFLPMIVNGSTTVKDFAQGIANMSDEGKESLVGVATGIVAVGAGAKVVSGTAKGLGGFVDALGKIGVAAPSLASMGPVALAVAGGIAAIGTAAYVGVKAYKSWYDENYRWSDGLSESNSKMQEHLNSLKTLNEYSNQVKDLNLIINSPDSSQEQVDEAKSKLEEIKTLLSDEYSLVIKSDNSNLEEALGTAKQREKYEVESSATELNTDLSEMYGKFLSYKEDYAAEEKLYDSAQKRLDIYSDLKNKATEINAAWGTGAIDYQERNKAIADIIKEAGIDPKNVRTEGIDLSHGIDYEFEKASEEAENYKQKLDSLNASRDEFVAVSKSYANKELELLNMNSLEGNAQASQENLDKIANAIKRCGDELDKNGYAQAASLAMNGISSLEDAWNAGGQTLENVVNDYITSSQKFGASAEQTAVGAALIKNGFKDIASAAADGGLETVAEQATEVERGLDKLDGNHSINISANGDIMVVDDTCDKIESIDGENVDIKLNAEGNYEVVNEFGETVKTFDGTAVNVRVNAEGNYEVLNETDEVIAEIDGKTAEVKVTADTSEPDNYQPEDKNAETVFEKDSSEPDNYQPDDKNADVVYGVDHSAVDSYNPPNKTATVTYSINTVVKGGLPSPNALANGITAKGTSDAKAGFGIINDEKGVADPTELLIRDGVGYTFEGRDVPIMFKKHDVLLTASQTKDALASLPHYASGKNNEAWETAKSDREHIRKTTYNIIPAWEELEWLDEMKQKFASDAEVIKEIEEEVVTYTKQMWQDSLDTMQYSLDMGWISQEEYYSKLAVYRDENFAPDTEEYRDATLKLHKHSVQLIEDANEVSKAYIDLHGSLNDWNEMGTSMGEVWQTINRRNVQAANDGLITWEDYFDTRSEYTEQFLDNYIAYSDAWIDREKEYNNMSADDAIAAIDRQRAEVRDYFAELGELTDEEYAYKVKVELELEQNRYDEVRNQLGSWEDDWQWQEKRAEVYGWENIGEDKLDFYQRVADKYTAWSENPELDPTKQQYARRQADEAQMELYKATEDYYDDILSEAKDRMDEVEKLLDDKLSALEESWEVEDRAEDKSETLADIEKYKNAVTIEGKEKYQEALDKLKEIEREEEKYQLELENNAIMEQMQADYEALEAEKEKILQQTRDANAKIATLVEPLKASITDKTQALIDTIKEEIGKIKPSVTVTQTNNINVADKTDAILYSNNVFNKFVEAVGG